jgi:Tol biopolymer transport system component/ferric-dicitrate binding protein FerR (iron transport regulator)
MISPTDLDLLQAYLDRRLGDSETAAVEVRLRAEPSLARTLILLAREEAILTEWAKGVRVLEETRAEEAPSHHAATSPGPNRRRWLVIGAAIAATVALAISLSLLRGPSWNPTTPVVLAVLEEVQGDVYVVSSGGRVPAQAGQELFSGHELDTSGEGSFAAVKYGADTHLELGADTHVGFDSQAGQRVVLTEGMLTGHRPAPPDAAPMRLATPQADVLVHGKRFSFTTTSDSTLVEMEDGSAYLTRRSDGKVVNLPAGSLVVSKGAPLKPRPLVPRVTKFRALIDEGTGPVLSLAWPRNGNTIASGGSDGTVRLWDLEEREVRLALHGHKRPVRSLAFGPDGSWLVGVSDEKPGHLRIWDTATGTERHVLKAPKGALQAVAVSPDGHTIASGGAAGKEIGEVRLWDAITGQDRGGWHAHLGEVIALAFSGDGKWLATAGNKDNLAKLWDLETRRELHSLSGHTKRITAVAFAPDNRILVTASRDGSVRLWDVASGAELRSLPRDGREVRSVAFSPDGLTLATANGDLVKLWDLDSGSERIALKGHRGPVTAVAFSPNGKLLATAGSDRTVRLWDVPP